MAPVRVGLRAQLTGCPIALQESSVGLDCTVSPSLLNFGTMPHSSASRRRVISVKNNSPLPAKLSWRAAANADKEPDFFEVKFNFVDEPKKSASSDNSEDAQQQQQQQTSHNWVSIAFNEKTHPPLPFRITPLSADIEPRSLAKFEVEYDPPQAAELSKALLISKVDWKVCLSALPCPACSRARLSSCEFVVSIVFTRLFFVFLDVRACSLMESASETTKGLDEAQYTGPENPYGTERHQEIPSRCGSCS